MCLSGRNFQIDYTKVSYNRENINFKHIFFSSYLVHESDDCYFSHDIIGIYRKHEFLSDTENIMAKIRTIGSLANFETVNRDYCLIAPEDLLILEKFYTRNSHFQDIDFHNRNRCEALILLTQLIYQNTELCFNQFGKIVSVKPKRQKLYISCGIGGSSSGKV